MLAVIFFLFIMSLFWLVTAQSKISFLKVRDKSEKLTAVVVEYRKAKVPIRNDYSKMDYPFVRILSEGAPDELVQLRYASSWQKYFAIGEKVEVFWYLDRLCYWHAMDNGLNKYLPESWNVFAGGKR